MIHTLKLKLWHFEVFPYVYIGSHSLAMFAHKKNYGRAGYVDDPLPNIVYHIAGNFGEVFNLVIWRILKKIAKLKLANI